MSPIAENSEPTGRWLASFVALDGKNALSLNKYATEGIGTARIAGIGKGLALHCLAIGL